MAVSTSHWRSAFLFGVLLALAARANAQTGELDHSLAGHGIIRFNCGASSYGNKEPNIKTYPASSTTHAGKIVVAGTWWDYSAPKNGAPSFAAARYLADGTPDTSFGTNGVKTVAVQSTKQDYCNDFALQSDDKVVLVGRSDNNLGIARLTASGELDTTFSGDGLLTYTPSNYSYSWAYSVAVQKDGKIVVGGYGNNGPESWFLLRLNSDGTVSGIQYYDFESSNHSEHLNRLILDDGASGEQNIYATGSVHDGTDWLLCTLKVDKNLTEVWRKIENPLVHGGGGYGLALHDYNTDGKPEVVVGGEAKDAGYGNASLAVVYTDGTSEATRYAGFKEGAAYIGSDSTAAFSSSSVAVDGDGKIILAGTNTLGALVFTRLDSSGNEDSTYGVDGHKIFSGLSIGCNDFCLDASGKVLSTGESYPDPSGTYTDFTIMRLLSADQPMAYMNTTNTEKTTNISQGVTGGLLRILVCVNGEQSPFHVTSFSFNTAGTTAPGTDITAAKVFYTGTNPNYYQKGLFGTATAPNGAFTITGSQALSHGDNYFWLAYSVPKTATLGNVVDATCTSVTVGGEAQTPSPTAPAGSRTVSLPAYTAITGYTDYGDYITHVGISTIDNTSVANAGGYGNFTADCSPELNGGQTYTLSCTIAGSFPTYTAHVVAWFDWNHNYDFSDPGEEYTVQATATSTGPHTINIAVPADVTTDCTRFRVALRCDGYASAPYFEDAIDYGEAEDYSFTGIVTNVAPVITQGAGPLSVTMSEDGAPTAWSAPTLGATDADAGDTLTWSVSSAASHGTATVSGTGGSPSTFTYAPSANWSGSDSFTVQVSDGTVADTIVVNVTVQAVNDAPVITGQSALSTAEDTSYTIVLGDLTVTDADNTYPTGFSLTVSDGTNYTHTGNTITPASNFTGTLTVPVKVNDGTSDSGSYDVSVSVTAVNDAPVLGAIGNKSVREGETLSFTLSATDAENNGLSYSATNLPSGATLDLDTGEFSWEPGLGTASTYNGIAFTVTDDGSPARSDSETISITVQPMVLTLTAPNGGQSWKRTTTHTITWTCTPAAAPQVKFRLYKNGLFVRFLGGEVNNTGSWNWTVPENLETGNDYKIMIYTPDYAYSDMSNSSFSIAPAPLRLTSPVGGETWKRRTAHKITWQSDPEVGSEIKLQLHKGGTFLRFLSGTENNTGSWNWTIPADLAIGNDYTVMIYTPDYAYRDYSETAFSIAEEPLRLTTPNGGESWKQRTTHQLSWTNDPEVGSEVKFKLYKGGVFVNYMSGIVSNTGKWNWTIPGNCAPGNDYTVMIYTPNYAYTDSSAATFSITRPPLWLTSPNGGETLTLGTTTTLTWTGDPETGAEVKFKLYRGEAFVMYLAGKLPNNGTWNWNIPATLAPGTNYQLQIYTPNYGYMDYSDAPFTLATP